MEAQLSDSRRAVGKELDMGQFGGNGIHPIGVKALLDASGLNKENLWQKSKAFFSYGVVVPRAALSMDTIERRIGELAQHYPVNGNGRTMSVAVHEKSVGNNGKAYLFRGDHLIGDSVSIARLWAHLYTGEIAIHGWNIRTEAMCWNAMVPGSVFVPYIDLDELAPSDEIDDLWGERIGPVISSVNQGLCRLGFDKCRVAVFYNCRQSDKPGMTEMYKHSFHLHWYELGVRVIGAWKSFLLSLENMPRKIGTWKKTDTLEWVPSYDEESPIFDCAVYGGKSQLFRGPFCGKRGDANSVLLPLSVTRDHETGSVVFKVDDKPSVCCMIDYLMQARISVCPSEVRVVDFPVDSAPRKGTGSNVTVMRTPVSSGSSVPATDPFIDHVHNFAMPFLVRSVLPAWQMFRQKMVTRIGGVEGAVVPTENLVITREKESGVKGRTFFSVKGDTFCECDSKHIHRANPGRIGIVVDFLRCTISQTCFVCGPAVKFPVYCFLHAGNRISIEPKERCGHSRISCWTKSPCPHQLILDYFWDRFVYQRGTSLLYAYDEECRVWKSELGGNSVVGKLIDELNQRHAQYINAQRRIFMDSAISRYDGEEPEDEPQSEEDHEGEEKDDRKPPRDRREFIKRLEADSRVFVSKRTPLISFTAAARGKLLSELRCYVIHVEVPLMNPYGHLIPMKNRQCIDVFTGEICDIEPSHYFTSAVNAKFNPDDENIPEIEKWFREVSTGDAEKCVYLKRIGAYCFTFLMHDRKYYILVGNGRNGKGMFKEFIVCICTGASGHESRVKHLNQQFWALRSNAGTNAESATPEAFDMRNCTFYYTDDIGPVALDAAKIKRNVAHEELSARGLYGNPCTIKPRGKIMHTSNFDPAGPGDDPAYWDRTVVVKMLAKYVEEPSMVNHSKFRFLKDQAVYNRLLTMLDAFFTVSVTELIKYYKSVTRNGAPSLASFPVPEHIARASLEAKEKRLPLAAFFRLAMEPTREPLQFAKLADVFDNYMIHLRNCNETAIAKATTITKFEELLALALDIRCIKLTDGPVLDGQRLARPVCEQSHDGHSYTGFVSDAQERKH